MSGQPPVLHTTWTASPGQFLALLGQPFVAVEDITGLCDTPDVGTRKGLLHGATTSPCLILSASEWGS